MKTKATKLLSFILALTLLVSSFVVVGTTASAADETLTGKTTVAKKDTAFGASTTDEPGNFTANLADLGVNGMGVVGSATDAYYLFYFKPNSNSAANNSEISLDLNYDQPINLAGTSYVVVDFEFSVETAIVGGFAVDLVGSRNGAAIAGGDVYFNSVEGTLFLDEANAVADSDSVDAGISTPFYWRHYTVVADVVNNVTYVYVDGEFYLQIDSAFNGAKTNDAFRIVFPANSAYITDAFAFDNIEVTAYSTESNVNFASVLGNHEKNLAATNEAAYANVLTSPVAHVLSPIATVNETNAYYSPYELGKNVVAGDYVVFAGDHDILTPVLFRTAADEIYCEGTVPAGTVYAKNAEGFIYVNSYKDASGNLAHTSSIYGIASAAATDLDDNYTYGSMYNASTEGTSTGSNHIDYYVGYTHDNQYNPINGAQAKGASINFHGNTVTQHATGYNRADALRPIRLSNKSGTVTVMNGGTFDGNAAIFTTNSTVYLNEMKMLNSNSNNSYLVINQVDTNTYLNHCELSISIWVNLSVAGTANLAFNHCDITGVLRRNNGSENRTFFDITEHGVAATLNTQFKYNVINAVFTNSQGFIRNYDTVNSTVTPTAGVSNYNFNFEYNTIDHSSQFLRMEKASNWYTTLNGNKFVTTAAFCWNNASMTTGMEGTANVVEFTGENLYATQASSTAAWQSVNGSYCSIVVPDGYSANRGALLANTDPETSATFPYKTGYPSHNITDYMTVGADEKLKVNLTLNSDINFNLYIPVSLYDGRDTTTGWLNGVYVNGKYMGHQSTGAFNRVTLDDGVEYFKVVVADINPQDAGNDLVFELCGKTSANKNFGVGQAYLAVTKTFNVVDYAIQVYNATADAETKTLMADIIGYVYEAAQYAQKDYLALAHLERTLYGEDVAASEYAPTTTVTDQSEIKDHVSSAYMALGNVPSFVFTVAQDAKVTLKYTDAATGVENSLTYEVVAGDEIQLELRAYNLTNTITIEVEGIGSGTYDLYTYVESQKADTSYDLLKALYMYSVAAKANIA